MRRRLRVPGLLLLCMAGSLAACFEDRPRPAPVEPEGPLRLAVEVLSPAPNTTVAAGSEVLVDVHALDPDGSRLAGFGYAAYREQGNVQIDSTKIFFSSERASARDTFRFTVPAEYPSNTQVDVYGYAFGAGGVRVTSFPVPLIVVQCPGGPPC